MPAFEAQSSQFSLISGIQQPTSDMVLETVPASFFAPEARKGRLYIFVDIEQEVPRGRDACQLVIQTICKQFYDDSSYSVTSALRKAISAANKALYEQNFSASPQRRAVLGVSCAVIKGSDVYIAQVQPAQAYLHSGTKLRALPPLPTGTTPTGTAMSFKPGAIGASLSIDPEFYRAVLNPGDVLLLCTSAMSQLLDTDTASRMLRGMTTEDIAAALGRLCAEHGFTEAHGLVAMIRPVLSPAAQAEPLSRAGVTERGRLVVRRATGWAGRLSGDVALLLRGTNAITQRRKAAARHEQDQRAAQQLQQLPEEPPFRADPPPPVIPLELGESLDERLEQERRDRRTRLGAAPVREAEPGTDAQPSRFLGEDDYIDPTRTERRLDPGRTERGPDLSDTPGMASFGRSYRAQSEDSSGSEPTLGERISQPFGQLAGALGSMNRRRRLRRPPPRALPRRSGGLTYRRQAPPFPWQWLLVLVLVVAAAVLYGMNLSRELTQRRANDTLERAATAVSALNGANEQTAPQLLDAAAVALADVRATGSITATLENRQRYDELEREYERVQAALQKLTYFDDLTMIAQHPVVSGLFTSVVVPPPPQGITNTAAFASIYMLDSNAGVLYRMPRNGGTLEPMLSPNETVGPTVVGKVKAQAWREDNIVAVAQSGDAGPFTFYFHNSSGWGYNTLAGSETWGRINARFRAVNYGGNLYVWGGGASSDQIQKYSSGNYGQYPEPWIKEFGGQKTANALDLAIDGDVYLLEPNGNMLVFSGGTFTREIVPQGLNPPLSTPAGFFVTGDIESGSIFLIDFNQRIIEIDKKTGALIQQVRARPDSPFTLDQLTSLYVDASGPRPVLYMVNGGQILRGALPDRPRPLAAPTGTPASGSPAPTTAP